MHYPVHCIELHLWASEVSKNFLMGNFLAAYIILHVSNCWRKKFKIKCTVIDSYCEQCSSITSQWMLLVIYSTDFVTDVILIPYSISSWFRNAKKSTFQGKFITTLQKFKTVLCNLIWSIFSLIAGFIDLEFFTQKRLWHERHSMWNTFFLVLF